MLDLQKKAHKWIHLYPVVLPSLGVESLENCAYFIHVSIGLICTRYLQ